MATQILCRGSVDDSHRPFEYKCTNAPNGIAPVLSIHRPGVGQFNFYFVSGMFTSEDTIDVFITSLGASGSQVTNATAYVRDITSEGFKVFTNFVDSPTNTSFNFMIVRTDDDLGVIADGLEGQQ
jgi:hypothetical protein